MDYEVKGREDAKGSLTTGLQGSCTDWYVVRNLKTNKVQTHYWIKERRQEEGTDLGCGNIHVTFLGTKKAVRPGADFIRGPSGRTSAQMKQEELLILGL